MKLKQPYRIGKKQKRAVLDAKGIELVIFPVGKEEFAIDYCIYLNQKPSMNTKLLKARMDKFFAQPNIGDTLIKQFEDMGVKFEKIKNKI